VTLGGLPIAVGDLAMWVELLELLDEYDRPMK
jgi:hypothetical protein